MFLMCVLCSLSYNAPLYFNAHLLLHVYYFYHIYSHAYLVMGYSAHRMEYNFGYKTMYYHMTSRLGVK